MKDIIEIDLSNYFATGAMRRLEIFKHLLAFDKMEGEKGRSYAGKKKTVYVGEKAVQVLSASLIDGVIGEQFAQKFEWFAEKEKAFTVGNTMIYYGINTGQTGKLSMIGNAQQLIEELVHAVDNGLEPEEKRPANQPINKECVECGDEFRAFTEGTTKCKKCR